MEKEIEIIEIGPREGLQYHTKYIDVSKKIAFIEMLFDAGFSKLEATSFVHPKTMPQMKDACRKGDRGTALTVVFVYAISPYVIGMVGELGLERASHMAATPLILFALLLLHRPALAGVLLGIGRMTVDSEIKAFRTHGVNLLPVFSPIILGGFLAFLLVLYNSLFLGPQMLTRSFVLLD